MYAIMGITGNVGGSTARALLQGGNKVRGIVRNRAKAVAWEAAGVELAVADLNDADALESAFRGGRWQPRQSVRYDPPELRAGRWLSGNAGNGTPAQRGTME